MHRLATLHSHLVRNNCCSASSSEEDKPDNLTRCATAAADAVAALPVADPRAAPRLSVPNHSRVRRETAFVGVEGYGSADASIGDLNKDDVKPTAYEEYLFVRSDGRPVGGEPAASRRCAVSQ